MLTVVYPTLLRGGFVSKLNILIRLIYVFSSLTSLVFILWSFTRGFDYTDEGLYLLAARHPNDIIVSDSSFFKLTSLLYKISFYNIIAFRVIGLLILLSSTILLFKGVTRYIYSIYSREDLPKEIDVLLVTINGSLLYYVFLPTPSYNLLNVALIYSCVGLLFLSLSSSMTSSDIRSNLINVSLGFIITSDFFIKFPPSLILFFTISLIIFLKNKKNALLFLFLGSGISFLTYFLFIQGINSWKKMFFDGIFSYLQVAGKATNTLKQNAYQIFLGIKQCIYIILPAMIPLLPQRFLPTTWQLKYSKGVLLFLLLILPFLIYHFNLYQGGWWPKVPSEMILCFLLLSASIYISKKDKIKHMISVDWLLLILILISVPIIGAIGTSVPIMGGVIEAIAGWPIAVLLLNHYLADCLKNNLYNLLTAYLMIVISAQLITSKVIFPERLDNGLFDQNTPLAIGNPPTVLQIDSKMAKFLISLKDIINKNPQTKNEKYILSFCDMPGFVFFLGKRSPGTPWFDGIVKSYNQFILERTDPSLIRESIILTNPEKDRCMPDLKEFGIDFPKNYSLVGNLEYPQLWWNVKKEMIPVDIWVPKSDINGVLSTHH